MKRFFSWALTFSLLCFLLLFAPMAYAEESETENHEDFKPILTQLIDMELSEWMESEETRALLTVALCFDLYNDKNSDPIFIQGLTKPASYVGSDGFGLVVYFHLDEKDLMILYIPMLESASYSFRDSLSDSEVEIVLNRICPEGYAKNDLETIYTAMGNLSKAFPG